MYQTKQWLLARYSIRWWRHFGELWQNGPWLHHIIRVPGDPKAGLAVVGIPQVRKHDHYFSRLLQGHSLSECQGRAPSSTCQNRSRKHFREKLVPQLRRQGCRTDGRRRCLLFLNAQAGADSVSLDPAASWTTDQSNLWRGLSHLVTSSCYSVGRAECLSLYFSDKDKKDNARDRMTAQHGRS